MTAAKYWIFDWFEGCGVRSVEHAKRLIAKPSSLARLQELAAAWEPQVHQPVEGNSILAGSGLDFESGLSCPGAGCQRRAVDRLLRHVWHYFDRIIITDNFTHEVAHHWGEDPGLPAELVRRIGVLLYLREIGADSLVEFKLKQRPKNWRKALEKAGFSQLIRAHEDAVRTLRQGAVVKIASSPGQPMTAEVDVTGGEEIRSTINIPDSRARSLTAAEIREFAVADVCDEYSSYLAADILTARRLGVPFGSSFSVHREILTRGDLNADESVAFHMDLPVLSGIPIDRLLRIREDEQEHFRRFQSRLKLAIQERAKSRVGAHPGRIAQEIVRDLIEPELRKIRERLQASEKLLAKKAGVGGFLASLATTCGLLAGAAPIAALGAGMAVIAPAVYSAASKHLEERAAIESEDMYFLWKAVGHAE
jgi:hypothetical protein